MDYKADYLIIGAGITGLAIALRLRARKPDSRIVLIEKEADVAAHASGRNSGVIHAGFYYTADSLKARFTVAGNRALKDFCAEHSLPVNNCGKLVVARNEPELERLHELLRRGIQNGSNVELISEGRAKELEPNIRTFREALYSPDTATIDPQAVCRAMRDKLEASRVEILTGTSWLSHSGDIAETSSGAIRARKVINCAGLYADKIAQQYGFGSRFTIIPFKGLYLKYARNKSLIGMHIYPVPDLRNPFLGVHFTKTVDGTIKIGPTAIPAFWRENYKGFDNFRLSEAVDILSWEARLFLANSFKFRDLAFEEMRKYWRSYFVGLARELVVDLDLEGFGEFTKPGIRAQLLNKDTRELVQDFVVEGDAHSVHLLNAVSPAFTCSLPFADYVIDKYVEV